MMDSVPVLFISGSDGEMAVTRAALRGYRKRIVHIVKPITKGGNIYERELSDV